MYRCFLLLILFSITFLSCRPEEEIITDNPSLPVSFSKDTVSFDTVFTSLGSISKRLHVYNHNTKAIKIDRIYLGEKGQSEFEITVGGITGPEFDNEIILGNDSLLILITVTIDPTDENLPFIVKDSIVFDTHDRIRDVKLRSWGQNAHFLGDVILDDGEIWTDEKPYYLTSLVLVDSLNTLTIEKGTRVFFDPGAGLFVKGTLTVSGSPDERVLFRNGRLDEGYENVPGQWEGIYFLEGSKNNLIRYADIRNSHTGLRVGTPDNDTIPDVVVKNTRIENTTRGGLIAYSSDVFMENTLINSTAGFNLANLAGGYYRYNHCTLANFAHSGLNQGGSVIFTNHIILQNDQVLAADLNVKMNNSIIWGPKTEEIDLNELDGVVFSVESQNCILKSTLNYFREEDNYVNPENMGFADFASYDYTPDSVSVAVDGAGSSEIETDLFGFERDSLPDIGAIEFLK